MVRLLVRWPALRLREARSGQAVLIFAIAIAAMVGMIGLGVDVGHAYERRQFVQGAAHNAARAGAFEVYANTIAGSSALTAAQLDAKVVERMVDTLSQSGLSVRNLDLSTPTSPKLKVPPVTGMPNWTACQANPSLTTTEVYLQAFYIDDANQQIHNGAGPYAVGDPTGTGAPSWAEGVEVTRLAMCVPRFFTGVVGHGKYDVNSGDVVVGLTETSGSGDAANAPFYMYGRPRIVNGNWAPSLYGVDAPDLGAPVLPSMPCGSPYVPSCIHTPGDLVTFHDHDNGAGNWDAHQYYSDPYGKNYTTEDMGLHDSSNRGCLDINDPAQDVSNLTIGNWYYNWGGTGHCATPPPDHGTTVLIPVVDEACKDNSCQDGTTLPAGISQPCNDDPYIHNHHGGYCVRIVALVLVYVTTPASGHLSQGYITGVVNDPYCIVEIPGHPPCAPPT